MPESCYNATSQSRPDLTLFLLLTCMALLAVLVGLRCLCPCIPSLPHSVVQRVCVQGSPPRQLHTVGGHVYGTDRRGRDRCCQGGMRRTLGFRRGRWAGTCEGAVLRGTVQGALGFHGGTEAPRLSQL